MTKDDDQAKSITCEKCNSTALLEHNEDVISASGMEYLLGGSNVMIESTDEYICHQCGWKKIVKKEIYPM